MEQKYYAVEAKCGHVGRKNCIIITFGIVAESKKDAARISKNIPRVKHDHKDAIVSVNEISYDEYLEIRKNNSEDYYLRCSSKQEQRILCDNLNSRIIKDSYYDVEEVKQNRQEKIAYKKKKHLAWIIGDKYCLNSSFI